jgi:hypothetical protein
MTIVSFDKPLYAYSPDETLRGAIPFYTGRYLVEVNGIRQVEELLKTDERVFIIIRDKQKTLENELLSTGRFSIVFQREMGGKRLVLFSNDQPQAFIMVTPPEESGQKEGSHER